MTRFYARWSICAALSLFWLGADTGSARAQFERYELGRRVRSFEIEWDRGDNVQARPRASQELKKAVNAFFAFRLGDAARAITGARFALRAGASPSEGERWAESLCIKPEVRLLDTQCHDLNVTVGSFYPIDARPPANARIRLDLGGPAASRAEAGLGPLPLSMLLPLDGMKAGDHVLTATVRSGETVIATVAQTISLVDRLADRMAAVKKTIGAWPEGPAAATADRESARSQLRLLESLAAKMTLESDFPAGRMLATLEEQTAAADRSQPFLGKDRAGQFWVTLVTRTGRRVATRVFVPESAAKGSPLPLVVALHGAGGSENMFFDSYGHGAIVDRCRERGWLLIAPRGGAFGGAPVAEVVDALASLYPIDRKRVMLVGHSMGAHQAVATASSDPAAYAAVAALGGGGVVHPSAGLGRLPFFVGIGTDDFMLRGAKDLVSTLERAHVATVAYREYPAVEHLAIVQVALTDVFRFFDERARVK